MSGRIVLGVDSSTSATKVIAFDLNGRVMAQGSAEYELYQDQPGWVEQSAEDWWTAFAAACREVTGNTNVEGRLIAGIGLTHQRFTFVPVDCSMQPLRRAILWNDIRCSREAELASRQPGKEHIYGRTGYPPGQWTLYKALWLKNNEPSIYERIYKLMLVQDYLIYRLTDDVVTLQGACTMTGALDIANPSRWALDIIRDLGVREDIWIDDILPGATVAGRVSAKAADETGLPEGLPVVTGAGDQPCGILGAGVTGPGELAINGGTSCTNELVVGELPERRKEINYLIEIGPSGDYILENYIPSGGSALMGWYRNNFGRSDEEQAQRSNRNAWEFIYSRAGESPPGNRGVMVLPFFQGANGPYWNLNARGMVLGLHTEHGGAHLIRGLIEGLAYESRRQMELMQEGGATEVRQVKMYGGSARSDYWNQIFADVLNRELQLAESEETTALGAAISAAVGCGEFDDFRSAVKSMVSIKKLYRPVARNAARYEKYYRRVYLDLYSRVQESMQAIAEINRECDAETTG